MNRGLALLIVLVLALGLAACPRPAGQTFAPTTSGGRYYCHNERAAGSTLSMCRPSFDHCEAERQSANAQGYETSVCVAISPVACFQLGGDPSPTAEWCAATVEDCEHWRKIDEQKNAATGAPCAWIH